jgi:hypothetical protein
MGRTYRVYRVDRVGKLAGGEWITATDDADVREAALKLCQPGTPSVEIWEGRRLVGSVSCPEQPRRASGA